MLSSKRGQVPGTDEDVWTQELTSFVVMGSGTNTNLKSAGYFLPRLKRERDISTSPAIPLACVYQSEICAPVHQLTQGRILKITFS